MPKFLNIKYIIIVIVISLVLLMTIKPNAFKSLYCKPIIKVDNDEYTKKNWGELIKRAQVMI